MKGIITLLNSGNYSCVVEKDGQTYTFTRNGVADLYGLVTDRPGFLENAFVADKVVGKAAAALLILGKISRIYAGIISRPALELLCKAEIEVETGEVVPAILNRKGTGWCPLEKICCSEESAAQILSAITNYLKSTVI